MIGEIEGFDEAREEGSASTNTDGEGIGSQEVDEDYDPETQCMVTSQSRYSAAAAMLDEVEEMAGKVDSDNYTDETLHALAGRKSQLNAAGLRGGTAQEGDHRLLQALVQVLQTFAKEEHREKEHQPRSATAASPSGKSSTAGADHGKQDADPQSRNSLRRKQRKEGKTLVEALKTMITRAQTQQRTEAQLLSHLQKLVEVEMSRRGMLQGMGNQDGGKQNAHP